MKNLEAEIALFETLLVDRAQVQITLPMSDLFLLIGSLQFAASDPRLTDNTRETITDIGRKLTVAINMAYPAFADTIEEGWLTTPTK